MEVYVHVVAFITMVSIPPKIDIPDTPELSILRFDTIFDDKSNMAVHPRRLSTAETQ